jgi:hypothetical protein
VPEMDSSVADGRSSGRPLAFHKWIPADSLLDEPAEEEPEHASFFDSLYSLVVSHILCASPFFFWISVFGRLHCLCKQYRSGCKSLHAWNCDTSRL